MTGFRTNGELVGPGVQGVEVGLAFVVVEEGREERAAGDLAHLVALEAEGGGRRDVVVTDVAAEVRGIVRVDGDDQAAVEHLSDRVVGQVVEDAELHVRQWADRERNLLVDQPVHQRLVLHAPDPVVDAPHVQQVEGFTDVCGRALLPRVRHRQQPFRSRPVEHRLELRRRVPGLRGVESDRRERVAMRAARSRASPSPPPR